MLDATSSSPAAATTAVATTTPAAAALDPVMVADNARMGFLPRLFSTSPRLMLGGESEVYALLRGWLPSYSGGFWDYFNLPDGSPGFMQLRTPQATLTLCTSNGDVTVTPQAAGIILTLYALSNLSFEASGDAADLIIENFHRLRAFALRHPERDAIFEAID